MLLREWKSAINLNCYMISCPLKLEIYEYSLQYYKKAGSKGSVDPHGDAKNLMEFFFL